MSTRKLSHLDKDSRPAMVDVSGKKITERIASAAAVIRFPDPIWEGLEENQFATKKGPILDVARIAGTMGVKQTASLIPFCHTLPVEDCSFKMEVLPRERLIRIQCTVKCTGKTGVEMEALTGASTAALAIYDMTKSLGQGITIEGIQLIMKKGGKQDYERKD